MPEAAKFKRSNIGQVSFLHSLYHSPFIFFLLAFLRRSLLFDSVTNMSLVRTLPQPSCDTFVLFFDIFQSYYFELAFQAMAVSRNHSLLSFMSWVRESANDAASQLVRLIYSKCRSARIHSMFLCSKTIAILKCTKWEQDNFDRSRRHL